MVPRPRAAVVSQWSSDPHFRTAYSYLRPGGTPRDRALLGEPVGPGLYLAGEAASVEYPGTMHGAWFTGEQAARAVIDEGRARQVAVIGAGMAGIAAAHTLAAAGAEVAVFEAGDEAGGRVRTDRSIGGPVHLGAAWIHGDRGNPVADAAHRAGLHTEPSQWGRGTTFVAGVGRLNDDQLEHLSGQRGAVYASVNEATTSASVTKALGPLLRSTIDRVAKSDLDRLVLDAWVRGIYENLYAAPVDDLSLVYAAEPFGLPGDDLTVLDGFDTVVTMLTADLDVRLNQVVRAIVAEDSLWSVQTDTATFVVDAAIVTVPVGVLQSGSITFVPPLPASLTDSLSRIGAGQIGKVFLAFDEAFWAPDWSFWTLGARTSEIRLWADASKLAGRPMLCGFFTQRAAATLERMSNEQLVAVAHSILSETWVK
jgi:polyamine oxidase